MDSTVEAALISTVGTAVTTLAAATVAVVASRAERRRRVDEDEQQRLANELARADVADLAAEVERLGDAVERLSPPPVPRVVDDAAD
jgi:hypothetical protein